MKHFSNWKTLLAFILLSAVFLRIWQLDKVPTGISDDELGFLINAKAVFLTGKDIAGNWSPYSLTTITGEFPQAEIPYLIMSPFVGLPGFSLFWSKLPYAVISVLAVLLLFLITQKLIGKQEALIVGLTAAFNPWSIFFGRTAYEAPLAIFFYLVAFYTLLISRGWKILIALIPLFLAFYSYMGTKLIFLPFVIILSFYSWFFIHKNKYLKQYLILIGFCLALFLYFLFTVQSQATGSRLSEISSPLDPSVSKTVDNERRLSIHTPLTEIFSNKVVVWGKESVTKYLKVFSTELLFVSGEGRSTFSLWYHGYFYYLDFFFLIIGLCVLFAKKPPVFALFTAFVIIAPIPTVVSNSSTGFAALRASLMYPIFIILIGVGIWHTISFNRNFKYQATISAILLLLYGFHLLNFINIYFFRNPIYNAEAFSISSRILSRYITHAANRGLDVVVISNDPQMRFKHYLFDTNTYNRQTAPKIKALLQKKRFELNNARFVSCSNNTIASNNIYIIDEIVRCEPILNQIKLGKILIIPQLADSGTIYKIYNDSLCKQYQLNSFVSDLSFSDLSIENLPEKRYCETYIINQK